MLIGSVGNGRSFDSFRRELEEPCETGGNRKTEDDQDEQKSNRPIWSAKHGENLGDSLGEGPTGYGVGDSDLVDVASLQLAKETCPVWRLRFSAIVTRVGGCSMRDVVRRRRDRFRVWVL